MSSVTRSGEGHRSRAIVVLALTAALAVMFLARTSLRPGEWQAGSAAPAAVNAGSSRQPQPSPEIAASSAAASAEPSDSLRSRYDRAFTRARQGKRREARQEFARLRLQAESLKKEDGSGVPVANPQSAIRNPQWIAQEAAYQHAVLTAALGDKPAAAKEYLAIVKEFPESEQAVKAARRLAAMHKGKLLPQEQKVWDTAQRTAQERRRERMRAGSMCGPEVVAELLRRKETGPAPSDPSYVSYSSDLTNTLAKEMKADEFGTSIKSLQQALEKRDYQVKGLKLTLPALWRKKIPAIALLKQGHFVLVDRIAQGTVETWDPNLNGVGGPTSYDWATFEKAWTGMALILN